MARFWSGLGKRKEITPMRKGTSDRLLRLERLRARNNYIQGAFVRAMQCEFPDVSHHELASHGKQLGLEFDTDDVIEMTNRLADAAARIRVDGGVPLMPTMEQMRMLCRDLQRKRKEKEQKQREADRAWADTILQCLKESP
jgi:hypothetical protein